MPSAIELIPEDPSQYPFAIGLSYAPPDWGLDAAPEEALTAGGSRQQFPAVIELGDMGGDRGFELDGAKAYDFVYAVSAAGDINGDGIDDVIVGATLGKGDDDPGEDYLVYGRAGGGFDPVDTARHAAQTGGSVISGGLPDDKLGRGYAAAGDVNGDGVDDLLLSGRAGHSDHPAFGGAYVVFGQTGGLPAALDLHDLDGSNGFRIASSELGDYAGVSVSSAGDINGDGFADLLIGAPWSDAHGDKSGSAYVVFGHAGGFDPVVDLDALDGSDGFRINAPDAGDQAGIKVAKAGDFNGDGIDDFMVGAINLQQMVNPPPGEVYLVFGTTDGFPATLDLADIDGSNGFRMVGQASSVFMGEMAGSAGDVNGDGLADVVLGDFIGARAYVVFGHTGPDADKLLLGDLDGSNGFELIDPHSSSTFGRVQAGAGDVNGDGFDDVVIGAPGDTNAGHGAGAVYVVFGHAGGFDPVIDVRDLDGTNGFAIAGELDGDYAGLTVDVAGDINGDGLADIILGAAFADPHGIDSGSAYVVYGRLPETRVDRTGTDASQSLVGGDFADRLQGLGGDDALWGHDGHDRLAGGDGADTLIGGAGKDLLAGGDGGDVFRFLATADSPAGGGHDIIADLGAGDVIDLAAIDADTTSAGDQAFHLTDRFHGQAGELWLRYDAGADVTTLRADVDGDGSADLVVKLAGDHHDFTDFVL